MSKEEKYIDKECMICLEEVNIKTDYICDSEPIILDDGKHMACSFHPELEDDVRLAKSSIKLLNNISWISNDINIIKCERFGNKRHRILVRPIRMINDIYSINHLLSKHSGTGGYIITPKGAKFLIKQKLKVSVSVDHYLFNPNNSFSSNNKLFNE